MAAVKKSATKYSRVVSAKAKVCAGKGTRAALKKAVSVYIKDAVAKAVKAAPKTAKKSTVTKKAKTEATRKANKVLRAACSVSIAGKKKKPAKKKKIGTMYDKPNTRTRACGNGRHSSAKGGACSKNKGLKNKRAYGKQSKLRLK